MTAIGFSVHIFRVNSELPHRVNRRYRGPACNIVAARRWETFLRHLKVHTDERGSATPDSRYVTPDGYHLGYRAGFYRSARRRGHLPQEQIAVLDALNGWKW